MGKFLRAANGPMFQAYNLLSSLRTLAIVYHLGIATAATGDGMRAVVLEGPGQAQLASVAEPQVAGEDEILLRVRKIGLCGSDLNSYRGRNPLVSFPRIPGHEIS